VGLIAIIPNIFPIIINFGIMGWLGIELSMVTSLIASIAIGLAVDDTIHYLTRYNREFRKDLDDERAIRDTLHHVGRPIIFTTITICVGFSVLFFSNFKPTAIFGVMMVITSLSALVGDLILLPSLIRHVELVTLWDLVRLKLGKEPRMGIPLFKELSRAQFHYILMAGSITKIDTDEILFRKGDSSNSMYTLISGTIGRDGILAFRATLGHCNRHLSGGTVENQLEDDQTTAVAVPSHSPEILFESHGDYLRPARILNRKFC
jgi:hypothetical protein